MDNPTLNHLVITEPDRYYGEAITLLWIDWNWQQIEQCIAALQGSPIKIVIHLFGGNDTDFRWLLNVANQVDAVIVNLGQTSQADPIKGMLVPKDKTHYFGRKDLKDIFPGYIDDPLGTVLALVEGISTMRKQ